jgi:hypothetical protein
MKTGLKVGLGGLVALVLGVGGELLYLHHRNADDQKTVAKPEYKMDPDDMATYTLKHEHPMSLQDEKDLKGRTLWMSAGGQMDYYPYNGHVDYAHPVGVLLGAEKILVKTAVEQVAPKSAAFRIPQGDKHVLLVFTKPDDPKNPTKEYAVPVGYKQGGDYTFETDNIFFYEDPHKVYTTWSPEIWKAVDEHRAILGMKENQVQMALGQISVPHGDKIGDRSVEYDDQGKPKLITFENGKATQILDEKK